MLFYSVSNLLLLVLFKPWLEDRIIKLILRRKPPTRPEEPPVWASVVPGLPDRDGGRVSSVTLGVSLSSPTSVISPLAIPSWSLQTQGFSCGICQHQRLASGIFYKKIKMGSLPWWNVSPSVVPVLLLSSSSTCKEKLPNTSWGFFWQEKDHSNYSLSKITKNNLQWTDLFFFFFFPSSLFLSSDKRKRLPIRFLAPNSSHTLL